MLDRWMAALACVVSWSLTQGVMAAETPIRFNRDIRPILSNHCFKCHGPDSAQRKGGLRLDDRDKALLPAESGDVALVPGQPDASELVRRVLSDDPNEVMPPPAANKQLTAVQKDLLKRWVAEGAAYELHWAFTPPQRPELPAVKQEAWVRNAIDRFVLARLEREAIAPAPEAEKTTLFRRLSLDLTGLPPRSADVDAFVREMTAAEGQGGAVADGVYAGWVNKLLASPHFGERMAVDWLDAARFADSNGYQVDRDREMYPWRDWVIEAFNSNKPFDQFTVEQIAGDLLPGATLSQKIATGFHRNHMLNEEGGIIPEEFLAEYCADRVETTATVWLGQTFNCARCHDHKFDPFTQRDFYGLYAFFHNVNEKGIGNYGANIRRNAPPQVKLPAPELESRIAALQGELTGAQNRAAELVATLAAGQGAWEDTLRSMPLPWSAAEIVSASLDKNPLTLGEDKHLLPIPSLEAGTHLVLVELRLPLPKVTALNLASRPLLTAGAEQPSPDLQLTQWRVGRGEDLELQKPLVLRAAEADGTLPAAEVVKGLDEQGKMAALIAGKAANAAAVVEFEPAVSGGESLLLRLKFALRVTEKTVPREFQVSAIDADSNLLAPSAVLAVVRKEAKDRTPVEQKLLTDFRASKNAEHRALTERVAALTKQIDETDLLIPTTLVMEELPAPRATHIMIRGAYNKLGEVVTADTPKLFAPLPAELPKNRLGLARWLVDPANPLPARVTVNRYWQSLFGMGLVRTAEDFGTQGEAPSHPELLDWLATEFIRTGWDVKGMLRLIVSSATYRQSSRLTPALRERDPDNRLLARGPRFRLQGEFLRDQALAASGLLVEKIGGPSVKPYHPPGLYEQITAGNGTNSYVEGKGEDLYRRSMYTYWKRSVPHPMLLAFDASFREACTVRRPRTNTPLQALNLMNDPTYVESARRLAERMLREGGETTESRVAWAFRQVLARPPRATESAILVRAYDRALASYQADAAGAAELIKVGATPPVAGSDPARLAAWTTIATTILNLDETVTKE